MNKWCVVRVSVSLGLGGGSRLESNNANCNDGKIALDTPSEK